jgi:hypothetical protein
LAETKKGNKYVVVEPYERKQGGKVVEVPKHERSTPRTSKGKEK